LVELGPEFDFAAWYRRRILIGAGMSVINLDLARADRQRPDAEHVQRDQFGRPMYRFALAYEMDGRTWGADVWAYSFEDAERRVAAMRVSLSVAGQVHSEIAD